MTLEDLRSWDERIKDAQDIPTMDQPEALRQAYIDFFKSPPPSLADAESALLQLAYEKKFGEGISIFMVEASLLHEGLFDMMRKCLETGVPYKYPDAPKDALF